MNELNNLTDEELAVVISDYIDMATEHGVGEKIFFDFIKILNSRLDSYQRLAVLVQSYDMLRLNIQFEGEDK
tara:strand:+ start:158 stop:373 length:216 start_codon:yes stop_codon:yes gene_type:complete